MHHRRGLAAVAFFANPPDDFAVQLGGAAGAELIDCLGDTNEISRKIMCCAAALGSQLQGRRLVLFPNNNAAAGALIGESSRVVVILALIKFSEVYGAAVRIMMVGKGVVGG